MLVKTLNFLYFSAILKQVNGKKSNKIIILIIFTPMDFRAKKILLLIGDIIILYFSLFLTMLIREKFDNGISLQDHAMPFSTIFVVWIVVFYILDLYNFHLLKNKSIFFNSAFKAILISTLLSSVFFYINPTIGISPKTNLAIFTFISFFIFISWRNIVINLLGSYLPKNNIGIIGYDNQVKEIAKTIQENPHLGYHISFIVHNEEIDKINISELIKKNKISTIAIVSNTHYTENLRHGLFSSLSLGIDIVNFANFYEKITGKIPLDSINQMWFLENLSEGSKKWLNFSKRSYDLGLAFFILLVTAIFWPIIGLIIKLESTGPFFFTQKRVGKNNTVFKIIKFRTMKTENNNYEMTQANDQRITNFGKFLRKTRIDEIPQVLNIILGDMSFVGPRPERPELAQELKQKIPFYNQRTLVKPGLTGSDQVSGEYHSPSLEDTIKKLQYDLYYIKNRSIYLDLSILLKTIATVLSKKGI